MRTNFYPLVLGALLAGGTGLAQADAPAAAPAATTAPANQTVSPELVAPLQAAKKALDDKNYQAALDAAAKAEAAKASRTPFEDFVITDIRLQAYDALDDRHHLIEAIEKELASGQLPAEEAQKRRTTLSELYYQFKDYPKFLAASEPLAQGPDPSTKILKLRCQAFWLQSDWTATDSACKTAIAAQEKADGVATEQTYQLLMDAAAKRKDYGAYVDDLAATLQHYSKQDYWIDYLNFMRRRPDYSKSLGLDVYALRLRAGAMTSPDMYLDMADQAGRAGYPGEALQVLEKGQTVLAGDPTAAKLLADAKRQAAVDQKSLESSIAEAKRARNGNSLVNLGRAFASYGQYAKAAELINEGIAKGGLKDPDVAKLHLAIATLDAGQKDEAKKLLQDLATAPAGVGDLAKGWLAIVNQS